MLNIDAAVSLGPFAMYTAFPCSDYYDPSVPSGRHQPRRAFPSAAQAGQRGGTVRKVPTFTLEPIDGVGAQLCPCGIATTSCVHRRGIRTPGG